ncbi:MAG: tyrosine-type recombinase/integrase [Gammaproteobacteria bacterium]|nr:tyrosine-type recombinase/integrase [Gammaproteobacteria bacterium]
MSRKRINDQVITNAKPPPGKPKVDIFDDLVTGLCLRVGTRTKTWYAVYDLGRKTVWQKLGKARTSKADPATGSAAPEARKAARAAIELATRGEDPRQQPTEVLPDAARESFNAVADDYLELHAKVKLKQKTADAYERELKRVKKKIGHKPITQVSRRNILDITEGYLKDGHPAQATQTHRLLAALFNWCVARGILATSPLAGLKIPAKVKPRDRVLTSEELRVVWQATGALGYPFGPFVRLLLVTAQRETELAHMRWNDIAGDVWTIPDTKRGTPHRVTLPKTAREILKRLPRFDGPYVFSGTGGKKPVSGFSKSKRYLDAEIERLHQEDPDRWPVVAPWRYHDLRRTAASGMARLGVLPAVIEAVLNHRSGVVSGIARVYNVHSYQTEGTEALRQWGVHIEKITGRAEPEVKWTSGDEDREAIDRGQGEPNPDVDRAVVQ